MSRRATPKLVTPRTKRIVRRARVVTAIDRALRDGICWIAAPAGYGKTTAMLDYLQKKPTPHVWYRIDEGDEDIASFFHHIGSSLPAAAFRHLPVFGPEYADQPTEFARRFFRTYFARLTGARLLIIDDLHYAEGPQFSAVLSIMLRELPEGLQCVCLSRTLPPDGLTELKLRGRLTLLDQATLQFSEREARTLVTTRLRRRSGSVDFSAAKGWAAGLVLLADRAAEGNVADAVARSSSATHSNVFAALAQQLFNGLTRPEQEAMLRLSLLPDITADLATDLTGSDAARTLLTRLHQRQLLVTRGDSAQSVFHLHDLLRDFLRGRLTEHFAPAELAQLRQKTAAVLAAAGNADAAIDLALQAQAWPLARRLIVERAETLLAQGRRATLNDWCDALPAGEREAWICYWLGVANMADDATAENWLARAWESFTARGELDGQCLTAARAVLSKSESWRTHEGLAAWTRRVIDLIDRDFPLLRDTDQLLAWTGMLRAVDFAQDYQSDAPAVRRLCLRLLDRIAARTAADTANLRLMASQTLMDHAGSTGKAEIFEKAVDSIVEDLRASDVTPWVLGVWLVTFGSVTSRYFTYARRGFPYTSPEEALRAAVAIGEREGLRGVEFGALYHLQLLMKMRNDWSEFATVIARIDQIADSRFTTQVAVAADCRAALHTRQRAFADAYRDCGRFMEAIEAANEPPLERWPHFITQFQVMLADRRPDAAAEFLEGLIGLFDGALRQRTLVCVMTARALSAKSRGAADYAQQLRACLRELRTIGWTALFLNLPDRLAELCADGLELGIEVDFCRLLIQRRRLAPPETRPAHWLWPLRIGVLGEFRLEVGSSPLNPGAKAPTRSLDILRALAVARDHTCALDDLYEWLWPDAEGPQAKAACEQALHRLRKHLALPDVIVQREGKLSLAAEQVWIDLDEWERDLTVALRSAHNGGNAAGAMQSAFDAFGGPLFQNERAASWALPAIERVRSKFIDLATRLARAREAAREWAPARAVYLRALDMYPTSTRCFEGLIRNRLAQGDEAGAREDYERYVRILEATQAEAPSPAIRALVGPLLG